MAQMVPIRAYHAPATLRECLDVLERESDQVVVLAGGQSILPLLKTRGLRPEVLLDLANVKELRTRQVVADAGDALEIGAMRRHRDLWSDPAVVGKWSALADAAAGIGDRQIQNRGTLGGNLVFGTVGTDMKQVAMCLFAELRIAGPRGDRVVAALELFADAERMLLEPGELLKAVRFPAPAPGSGSAYRKYGITVNGRPVIGVAAMLAVDDAGICTSARIVVGGLVPCPSEAKAAAQAMVGQRLDAEIIASAANAAANEVRPQSDARASSAYRRQLVRVYGGEALTLAHKRARQGPAT